MKIVNTLPKASELFNHDSPVIRVVKLCLPAFIFISSLTVFLGVKAHLADYLNSTHWLFANGLYSMAYLLFSLAPDVLNVVLVAYLTRSFLKGQYNDRLGIVLLVAAAIMVVTLTRYSFLMSQTAAKSMVKAAAPIAEVKSVAPVDSLFKSEMNLLKLEKQQAKVSIEQRYEEIIKASTAPLVVQIKPLKQQTGQWEAKRNENNTFYVDLKLKQLYEQIKPLEQERLTLEKRLVLQKNAELTQLNVNFTRKTQALENRRATDLSTIQALNKTEHSTIQNITTIFTKQLSGIAGYAVFIVLLLAIIREILYHRNEINLQPILSPFDFQMDPIKEALYLPIVYLGRHWINWIRVQYQRLPMLQEPPSPAPLKPYIIKQLSTHFTPENKDFTLENDLSNDYENLFNTSENKAYSLKEEPSLNGSYENGSDHEKMVIIERPLLRDCEFCWEGFTPNHKKQKYCCEEHRRRAWEERTGRKLMLKRKK